MAGTVWNALAAGNNSVAFTQLPGFSAVGHHALGWPVMCLARESPPTAIPLVLLRRRAGIPVLAESLAYGMVGGPIAGHALDESENQEIARALARCALEVLVYPGRGTFVPPGWDRIRFMVYEVPLSDPARVWPQASRSCRGAARHAQRCGVRIDPVSDGPWIERIASLHDEQQRARKARGVPLAWIEGVLSQMPDKAGIWAAIHEDRPVAALMVGWHGEAATALLSAGEPGARPLKAGNLLYLSVLEELASRGIRSLDLGGSRDLPALEAFKRSLGGVCSERPFYRYRHSSLSAYQRVARALRD